MIYILICDVNKARPLRSVRPTCASSNLRPPPIYIPKPEIRTDCERNSHANLPRVLLQKNHVANQTSPFIPPHPLSIEMSTTLKSKKKPELQALAGELGVDTDGSKSDLEARILLHLSEHPELKSNSKFSKYFGSITAESPGPVAAVAQSRRRTIAAKKTTDVGEMVMKALTRYCVFMHGIPTCLF